MSDLTNLAKLIRLLKEQGQPSIALDWAIHCRNGIDGVGLYGSHPAYTAKVDDAMLLIPPHHLWELKQGIECRAIVWNLESDYDDRGAPVGYTTTFPALALCIAALSAQHERDARHSPAAKTEVAL